MAGTQFQRHETKRAGASKRLEDVFAVHDVWEMQHVVHQAPLGSAQREYPEPVRLPEDLRLDEQAVAEAIQNLVVLDLMGALEEIGQGALLRPVAALFVITHVSAPRRTGLGKCTPMVCAWSIRAQKQNAPPGLGLLQPPVLLFEPHLEKQSPRHSRQHSRPSTHVAQSLLWLGSTPCRC